MKFEKLLTNTMMGLPLNKDGRRLRSYSGTDYKNGRMKSLDFLFNVIGNGYDWKNGELVCYKKESKPSFVISPENYEEKLEELKADNRKKFTKKQLELITEVKAKMAKEDSMGEALEARDAEEEGCEDWKFYNSIYLGHKYMYVFCPYPGVSEYSNVSTIPDNVAPDFLEAAKENIANLRAFYEAGNSDRRFKDEVTKEDEISINKSLKSICKLENRIKEIEEMRK